MSVEDRQMCSCGVVSEGGVHGTHGWYTLSSMQCIPDLWRAHNPSAASVSTVLMMTIVNTYFRLPCNGMNCKYSDSGDFVAHYSSRTTSNRVTSVLATCFISLGTPAIIPEISTGSSLACNVWCCISLRPRNELVNEHRLTWFLLCCHIDRATSRPPRLLDTIPNMPHYEGTIAVSTNEARVVQSTPSDHRLPCLGEYHHSHHT